MADDSSALDNSAFISYASADAALANTVVSVLEQNGIRCWIAPRDVVPGSLYADGIVGAINETQFFVLVLSEHSLTSAHVGKELERASSKRHPIFAIRTDAAPLTRAFEYFLSESQWIDVGNGGVDGAVAKLASAMRKQALADPAVSTKASKQQFPGASSSRKRWLTAVVAGAAVVALGVLLVSVWPANKPIPQATVARGLPTPVTETTTQAVSEKSIAVLPFTDMSEKKDQEYLGDGMAEEILNLLAQAPDLLVSARTSSFYFKGKQTKIPDIARELGVTYVLEGSVRKSGDHLRVTAQLVRADNGYHLWSETYDRDLKDVFKVQDEIADAVAQALQIKMMGGELSRRKGGTQNLEAYQLYLRATSALYENTRPSLESAAEYLGQAIKLDPQYGLAWSQLAQTVLTQSDSSFINSAEGYGRVRQLAQHALQLSPDLAAAHAWIAYVDLVLDWDWTATSTEVGRALAIDPANPDALQVAGNLSNVTGHWDEAVRHFRASLVRDPLNPFTVYNIGGSYYASGHFAEAEKTYRTVLELAPQFAWTRLAIAKTLLAEGNPEAALVMIQQEPDEDVRLQILPILLQAVGRNEEADQALKEQIARWIDRDAFCVAATYAYRGEHSRALELLDRAFEQRSSSVTAILGFTLFRDDPHYTPFLRKMNLVE